VRVGELAEKLQVREKVVVQKEAELQQAEQRLATLQATLDKDRADLAGREKAVQEALAKLEQLKARPPIEPKLIQVYEKMDPVPGAKALADLARINTEVCVSLLAGMQPKKSAGLLGQMALTDSKLAAQLSEKVGLSKPPTP
jgi:flagellar motility protein MotE (MotC chaperone)